MAPEFLGSTATTTPLMRSQVTAQPFPHWPDQFAYNNDLFAVRPAIFTETGTEITTMTKISKRQADLIETRVDDELIVVSLANGEFYSLRDTALAIWNAINDVRSPEDLTRYLLPLFDAPEATVQADVAAFLADLEANGFIDC